MTLHVQMRQVIDHFCKSRKGGTQMNQAIIDIAEICISRDSRFLATGDSRVQ